MSRPRFLADHDINEHIVEGLLRREPLVEMIRARDIDMHGSADAELLQHAAEQGLIVVSHDVNTMPAAAYARLDSGMAMAGLLLSAQLAPVAPVIESLVLIWSASEAEEWQGVVAYLPL
jgi:hypothetical protein